MQSRAVDPPVGQVQLVETVVLEAGQGLAGGALHDIKGVSRPEELGLGDAGGGVL